MTEQSTDADLTRADPPARGTFSDVADRRARLITEALGERTPRETVPRMRDGTHRHLAHLEASRRASAPDP